MQRSFSRNAIIGAVVLALALVAGCSTLRLGYNQGPELAYWWLDRYFDFDDAQEPRVREAIGAWFRWHRSEQLPEYASLLARAQVEISGPATPAQMCRWTDEVNARLDRAFERALPPLAETVRGLAPQQLEHMERKYAKNVRKYKEDFLQPDVQERRRAQLKRLVERAEMLYGRVSEAQRERIAQLSDESPFDAEAWLLERRRRQQATVDALRQLNAEGAGRQQTQAVLQRLYAETFRAPVEAYAAYQQRLKQFNCAFAAQVHNLATPEQRAHAAQRLKGWEEDVRALSESR
ncbi:hypothetical protein BURC_03642 [Burkholderiaceae bacterium]|nr:hypothetical protein BURC_03642 [Burkholderiaceae bacterium]